MTKAVLSFD